METHRMRLFPLLVLPAWLVACTDGGGGKDADDTGDTGETGDTGTDYEEGCILVDGGGGYAHLADAIAVASDGATIELCDGTYEESVTVDKAVMIVGASEAGVRIVGQGVDPALRIEADGVSVSSLTVSGTYSGIVVGLTSGVSVQNVTFDQTEYWGLQLQNATQVAVDACTFSQPGAGAVEVTGGSATIADSMVDNATSYAFQISADAVVTLTGNQVNGVLALSEEGADGYGVNLLGATLDSSGNTFTAIAGMGVYGEESTLVSTNDVFSGVGLIGLFLFDTDTDITGLTLQDASLQGAYITGSEVSVADTTITVAAELTDELTYNRWGDNGQPWYGALLVAGDVQTYSNVSVSGYNNYGTLLVPYSKGGTATINADALSIDDTGRWGLWVESADFIGTGVSVTNLREPEMPQPCTEDGSSYSVDRSAGSFFYLSDVMLEASTFQANAGWGISNYQGTVSLQDSLVDGNICSGIINFGGVVQLVGNTFSHSSPNGALWDYQGTAVITGNTFVDSHTGWTYSYDDGAGGMYEFVYSSGQGVDINATSSTLSVIANTFSEGDTSLQLSTTEAEITGNTWTGYDNYVLYVYQTNAGEPVVFSDNEIHDQGNYAVFLGYGEVEIEDLVIDGMRTSSYSYEQYYNGKLSYSYTSQSYPYVFYGYSSTGYAGLLSVRGADIQGAEYGLGYLQDVEVDLRDIDAHSVGASTGATLFSLNWYNNQPIVNIEGFSVDSMGGSGLSMYYSGSSASYVTMSGLDFGTANGTALSLSNFDGFSLTDSDLGDPAGYGLYAYGVLGSGTTTIDNVTVQGAGYNGLYVRGGTVSITGSQASSSGYSGLKLETARASVTGNAFTSNSTYGMECSSVTLDACGENDLTGNGIAPHSGCLDSCAADSGGGDTGGDDTGGGDTGGDTGADTGVDSGA